MKDVLVTWNRKFRLNVVSNEFIVVFSERAFIGISGQNISMILHSVLYPEKRASKELRSSARKLTRTLIQHGVLKTSSSARKYAPISSSFKPAQIIQGLNGNLGKTCAQVTKGKNRIIYNLIEQKMGKGSHRLVLYRAIGITRQFKQCVVFSSSGIAFSENGALIRAIGEAIERQSLASIEGRALRYGRAIDHDKSGFDARSVVTLGSIYREDSDDESYSGDKPIYWIKGRNILTGAIGHIPAQLVFSPYYCSPKESLVLEPNSSGAAAARTELTAIKRAVLELIERHSMMRAWHSERGVRRIEGWEEVLPTCNKFASSQGISLFTFIIGNEFKIPTICALSISRQNNAPYITVGCAAALDWRSACRKAIAEALHNRAWLASANYKNVRETHHIRQISDHAYFYSHEKNSPAFSFMFKNNPLHWRQVARASFKNAKAPSNFSTLKKTMSALGYQIWIVDVSSPEARNCGFRVVRAIIPGLIPVQFGEKYMLAFEGAGSRKEFGSNIWPHPLA